MRIPRLITSGRAFALAIPFRAIFAFAVFSSCGIGYAEEAAPEAVEFFEKDIRPLLIRHCHKCHGNSEDAEGELQLTSRNAILKGGASGPAAIATNPKESLLIQAVHYDGLEMPPDVKLKDDDIAKLTRWVEIGLPWPSGSDLPAVAMKSENTFRITPEQRRFWSFQPIKKSAPPSVVDPAGRARSDIDRFILAKLEEAGMTMAAAADKRTLLRRATLDLTGLPPTPMEMTAFIADKSADAFAKAIDRLLASPQYGEHWGRHWLDLVRYADSRDSRGIGSDSDITEAWRYRDWVVRALNADLPYDQFIQQQIAGDLCLTTKQGEFSPDGLIATGLLAIGEWGAGDSDKEKMMTDIVDDQINVVSSTFMGLTVACARCHDHKFDPISAADYYALAGIFFSTHIIPDPGQKTANSPMLRTPLLSRAELDRREQDKQRVTKLETEFAAAKSNYIQAFAQAEMLRSNDYLLAAWDHRNPAPGKPPLSVTEVAQKHKLNGEALHRWMDLLGLSEMRLLSNFSRDVQGISGLVGWRGEGETPSLLMNTTDVPQSFLTIRMPARCISVHPSPQAGVAVAWKSPISGVLRVEARIADVDDVCGDGVTWALEQQPASGPAIRLASGSIPNGGQHTTDPEFPSLASVPIKPGEIVRLNILPGKSHYCDTTVVELAITALESTSAVAAGSFWSLTKDLLQNSLTRGPVNPQRDRYGNHDVWHYVDGPQRVSTAALDAALAQPLAPWAEASRQSNDYAAARAAIESAAQAFQQSVASSPVLQAALTSAESPFFLKSPVEQSIFSVDARSHLSTLQSEIDELKQRVNQPVPVALAAREGGVPNSAYAGINDARIMLRGSYQRLGETVPRGFPEIIGEETPKPITAGSGRRELAQWLTRPDHPLTARVMVNRIWQYHFGEGLVRTPSNFGRLGEAPTHPELLDYLAATFLENGWSIKAMHRALLLSAVYQQSSLPDAAAIERDPENRLWGRANRRRLHAEAIRDSVLSASGQLDETMGGPALNDLSVPRRTLYLMTIRSTRSGFRVLFDAPDPEVPTATRTVSTVAPQSLFLLNEPFVLAQIAAVAQRIRNASVRDDNERIHHVYELLYGRLAIDAELKIGQEFLAAARAVDHGEKTEQSAWEEYCQILLCANEFIYID